LKSPINIQITGEDRTRKKWGVGLFQIHDSYQQVDEIVFVAVIRFGGVTRTGQQACMLQPHINTLMVRLEVPHVRRKTIPEFFPDSRSKKWFHLSGRSNLSCPLVHLTPPLLLSAVQAPLRCFNFKFFNIQFAIAYMNVEINCFCLAATGIKFYLIWLSWIKNFKPWDQKVRLKKPD
jgi:hypothetical protein